MSWQFNLLYSIKNAINENLFEIFKKRNIPVNLHPYARELIQSSLTRVGLPPFTLPVFEDKALMENTMTTLKVIENEEEYQTALNRISELMDSEPGSDKFDELKVLAIQVESYENRFYPVQQ